jgi:hypothetical protein
MSRLSNALRKASAPKKLNPVWAGPAGVGTEGGVTFSLLNRYLGDKERFRLYVMDGWRAKEGFNPRLEFGTIWHLCEEAHAANRDSFPDMNAHCKELIEKYPDDILSICHWHDLAAAMFPEYAKHWESHPDVTDRTPLLQEQAFDVPYQLPSGRSVRLRGKWDSVDLIGKGKGAVIYLQENKTKSQVDGQKIERQCSFDLQTMLYLISLAAPGGLASFATNGRHPILGVRYNVIRRPAHKSVDSAMKKLREDMSAGRVNEWFGRWKVDIMPEDVMRFRVTCLDPVLENLLDDYEWWAHCFTERTHHVAPHLPFDWQTREALFPNHRARHFRYPYGVYNPLMEGGSSDLDAMLTEGSTVGLQQVDTLFPELAR